MPELMAVETHSDVKKAVDDYEVLERQDFEDFYVEKLRLKTGGYSMDMDAAYSKIDDSFIGEPHEAQRLHNMGIKPQAMEGKDHASIGWNEEEQRWYGWSHRAISGFGEGDEIDEDSIVLPHKRRINFVRNLLDQQFEGYPVKDIFEDEKTGEICVVYKDPMDQMEQSRFNIGPRKDNPGLGPGMNIPKGAGLGYYGRGPRYNMYARGMGPMTSSRAFMARYIPDPEAEIYPTEIQDSVEARQLAEDFSEAVS